MIDDKWMSEHVGEHNKKHVEFAKHCLRSIRMSHLPTSVRLAKISYANGIFSIWDFMNMSKKELLAIKNLGDETLKEINLILKSLGLREKL